MLTATNPTGVTTNLTAVIDEEAYLADMRVAEEARAIMEAAQIAYKRALFRVALHEGTASLLSDTIEIESVEMLGVANLN